MVKYEQKFNLEYKNDNGYKGSLLFSIHGRKDNL